jgi:hypothetical protein
VGQVSQIRVARQAKVEEWADGLGCSGNTAHR